MKTLIRVLPLLGVLALGAAAVAFDRGDVGRAAPKPACLSRAAQPEEIELAALHATWRYMYIPGTNPSEPLGGSAPLKAAALGLAHDLAEGSLAPGDLTFDLISERAIACGYAEEFAAGGRGVATGTGLTAQTALMLMTSEIWGGGIRVPAFVNGLEMRCVAVAHAAEAGASPGEAWVILIMGGAPECPQSLSAAVEPFDGGTPTATPSPPFTRPTKTPTPTATATKSQTPKSGSGKVFVVIARD